MRNHWLFFCYMQSHDFFDYYGSAMVFNPELYGFKGVYPMEEWAQMQGQYQAAWSLVSGEELKASESSTGAELYPLRVNLWDFVATIHATMMVGIEGKLPPRTIFSGEGAHGKSRSERYTRAIKKVWASSNGSLFWTAFFNSQVYGGYPLVARQARYGTCPLIIEGVAPQHFFPLFDTNGDVVEFFIYRRIPNRIARFRYGVDVDSNDRAFYIEYWGPDRYRVQINEKLARYTYGQRQGEYMEGENFYGMAPAVYVPHLRKTRMFGDSQIIPLRRPVLEFNARLADVSTAVRDAMRMRYWSRNVSGNVSVLKLGPIDVYNVGRSFESRAQPEIFALETPGAIKEASAFVDFMWDLILFLSDVPPIALGVDEGSQRSGMTLRVRFWSLESHCNVERMNAEVQINRLARIVIHGLRALGAEDVTSNGDDLDVQQEWPEMLPQDRAELVNELVQRKASGLVSLRTALRRFDDYDDLEEEIELIRKDLRSDQELKGVKDGVSRSNGHGDVQTRDVPQRGKASEKLRDQ